ncbi:type II secretion system F family protein [Marisediminicola sp. LYQ85]|uniref:type II secretion system F family protein n=1 Tax=Marisediminicola sp. LYQ85 TaxID=3391062 RepID=UPI0039838CB4
MATREPGLEAVSSSVHRLGVLLGAGVSPVSSWAHVAALGTAHTTPLLTAVARATSRGAPADRAILEGLELAHPSHRGAWRAVAAAWRVATVSGAPLAPTLGEVAASLRSVAAVQRDLGVALAGPVATARLVMVLPAVGLLFGVALGFDTIGTLFTTLPGGVCLTAGAMLMGVSALWNSRLLARARLDDATPGIELDLTAIAVSGGAALPRARTTVREAIAACGLADSGGVRRDAGAPAAGSAAESAREPAREPDAVDAVLGLSERAGVPAAVLLRSTADEVRRDARSEGERRAASLAVTLMLPLGICVLPAFMLLGVAPLLLSVISSTVDGF